MSNARTIVRLLIVAPVVTVVCALPGAMIWVAAWALNDAYLTKQIPADFRKLWSLNAAAEAEQR